MIARGGLIAPQADMKRPPAEATLLRRLQPGGVGPIVQLRSHVGKPGSPEQVVLLLTRWKPRSFHSDLPSERSDTILKGFSLFEMSVHDAAPFL